MAQGTDRGDVYKTPNNLGGNATIGNATMAVFIPRSPEDADPENEAARRLQADAQPGGHDGDVVLAAPRLLEGPRMNWSPSAANQRIG